MRKVLMLVLLFLALSACAHRQPKARCSGPLERINAAAPANTADPSPHPQSAPIEQPKDEGSEP